MEDKKLIQKAIYPNSVLFSEENIDKRLFKKLKKPKYVKDSLFLKLILLAENKVQDEEKYQQGLIISKNGRQTGQLYIVLMDRSCQCMQTLEIYNFQVQPQQHLDMFCSLLISTIQKSMCTRCVQENKLYKKQPYSATR